MAWVSHMPVIGHPRFDQSHESTDFASGFISKAWDENLGGADVLQMLNSNATAQYNASCIDEAMSSAHSPITQSDIGIVAVNIGPQVGINEYHWAQIQGKADIDVGGVTVVTGTEVYVDGTSGQADDTVVAGARIKPIAIFASANDVPGTDRAYIAINRPFTDDGVAS